VSPKIDVDRLCVKRRGGARDLLQTEVTYKADCQYCRTSEHKT